MTGFQSKRKAAADKLQEPVVDKGFPWTQKHVATPQVFGAMSSNIPPPQPAQEPEREALKLALEALEAMQMYAAAERKGLRICDEAIITVKEALAQPAQEPVAWKTMEAKYPSLEKLDIRMGDGSILCDVWPQSDGDFWWAGSGTGEKFIDPKYADVTHWRVHSDTTPPQREWVDMTDEEILAAPNNLIACIAYVRNKLKEKNT